MSVIVSAIAASVIAVNLSVASLAYASDYSSYEGVHKTNDSRGVFGEITRYTIYQHSSIKQLSYLHGLCESE